MLEIIRIWIFQHLRFKTTNFGVYNAIFELDQVKRVGSETGSKRPMLKVEDNPVQHVVLAIFGQNEMLFLAL